MNDETDAFRLPTEEPATPPADPGAAAPSSTVTPPAIDPVTPPTPRPAPTTKKKPASPPLGDDDAEFTPRLKTEDKVAWRTAIERRRIALKPSFGDARLVRTTEPAGQWVPVNGGSQVARK